MCSATVLSVTGRTKVNQNPKGPQAGSGPADATSPCYQRMAQNAMAVGGWDRQPAPRRVHWPWLTRTRAQASSLRFGLAMIASFSLGILTKDSGPERCHVNHAGGFM
jgi:hypothetical protein